MNYYPVWTKMSRSTGVFWVLPCYSRCCGEHSRDGGDNSRMRMDGIWGRLGVGHSKSNDSTHQNHEKPKGGITRRHQLHATCALARSDSPLGQRYRRPQQWRNKSFPIKSKRLLWLYSPPRSLSSQTPDNPRPSLVGVSPKTPKFGG